LADRTGHVLNPLTRGTKNRYSTSPYTAYSELYAETVEKTVNMPLSVNGVALFQDRFDTEQ